MYDAHSAFYRIDYMTLNPDQDAIDEMRSPPNPVPAIKRRLSNVGHAPAQLFRALSQPKGVKSMPAGPASIGETAHWSVNGAPSPV